ncbi:FAD-binding protein, partial [Pauljensenia sp. UMB3104]|nr:FAD-binding protein [Pauljensenia sp. UMB3104]
GALWRRAREPQASEGFGYIDPLTTYIEEHGGEIMTDTKADRFIVEDGKIVGIQATGRYDQKVTIHVNKGVVIATGGFGANIEMIKKYDNYWGNLPESIPTT